MKWKVKLAAQLYSKLQFFLMKQTNSNEIGMTCKKKRHSNSLSKFYWLSSSALQNRYILINFFVFPASKSLFQVWDWLSLCCACLPNHFGVNWPPTLCENKGRLHFFTLKFECHNKYNKLLLCNSENGIIARCKKTIQNWASVLLFSLRINTCFFSKNPKNRYKKTKSPGRLGFIKKQIFLNPDYP